MINATQKAQLTTIKDDLMAQLRDAWGVGAERNKQARRLADGIICKKDIPAIRVLATVVNAQLAIDAIEIKELENDK